MQNFGALTARQHGALHNSAPTASLYAHRVKQLIEADVIGPVHYVSGQIFVKMPEDEVLIKGRSTSNMDVCFCWQAECTSCGAT